MLKQLLKLGLVITLISLIILFLWFITADFDRACLLLEGATFKAFQEVPVLPDPRIDRMHPFVSFDQGTFRFLYSDMEMHGMYECKDGQISAHMSYEQIDGQFYPDTGILQWYGDTYELVQKKGILVYYWEEISRILFASGSSVAPPPPIAPPLMLPTPQPTDTPTLTIPR